MNIPFMEETKIINHRDAKENNWFIFNQYFVSQSNAILRFSCANYAEIYLNDAFVFRFCEKSYIFDMPYYELDISNFINKDENKLSILYCSTGENDRDGIIFEIIENNKCILKSDKNIPSVKYLPYKSESNFFIGRNAVQEVYDANEELKISDYPFEKDNTIELEIKNTKLTNFHISKEKFPAETVIYPSESSLPVQITGIRDNSFFVESTTQNKYGYYVAYISGTDDLSKTAIFFSNDVKACYYNSYLVKSGEKIELSIKSRMLIILGNPFTISFTNNHVKFNHYFPDDSFFDFYESKPIDPPLKPIFPWNEKRKEDKFDLEYIFSKIDKLVFYATKCTKIVDKNEVFDNKTILNSSCIKATSKYNFVITSFNDYVKKMHLFEYKGQAQIIKSNDISFMIVDFKSIQIGLFSFDIQAEKNTKIKMYFFETIDHDGIVFMSKRNESLYISNGSFSHFQSHVRRGFRYAVLLFESGASFNISNISVINLSHPLSFNNRKSFDCSSPLINEIFDISINTAKTCTLDTYIDCPSYEQNPWTGDAYVTSQINLYNFGEYEIDKHFHRLISQSITDDLTKYYRTNNPRYLNRKFLPCACFPTYPEGNIPIWSFMWMLSVYDHYYLTNDIEFIKELLPTMEETLKRCEELLSKRYLLSIDGAWNLIEWANNDLPPCGEVTANCILLYACYMKYSEIEYLVNNISLSNKYFDLANKIKNAINEYAFCKEKQAYIDTIRDDYGYEIYKSYFEKIGKPYDSKEIYLKKKKISVQTNTLAIYYDIVPEEKLDSVKRFLIDNIEKGLYVPGTPANCDLDDYNTSSMPEGYVHIGSPFFLFYAYKTLEKLNRHDLIYKSMTRDYSGLDFIGISGLYNTPEVFRTKNNKSRSMCHAWSASPAIFIKSTLLGVIPIEPGYKKFIIEPHLFDLSYIKGTVPTPSGPIYVEINRIDEDDYMINCSTPEDCHFID